MPRFVTANLTLEGKYLLVTLFMTLIWFRLLRIEKLQARNFTW